MGGYERDILELGRRVASSLDTENRPDPACRLAAVAFRIALVEVRRWEEAEQ